ncbi:restriction endonuclease subunit M [Aquimarina sp. AD10]|uniref:restriction endonuclease subunit M n=1 Tax=Aquimarina sp. AD10 TaxID=1714849 RepID=UPI000E466ED8|nr:N-6 DNA methylase [Aquimarina sp. AD10]AXT63240.1 restriction endonuclease subunit M [Aquimarina sp. AD10]RKN00747.1 restriction endonuclease subunit M [Aquimarina sp. AD10]
MSDWKILTKEKLAKSKNKVAKIDLEKEKVEYSKDITKPKIEKLGPEEVVRAFLVDKLVNELGYSEKNIELEKYYVRDSIGREKQKNKDDSARIDVIVKDKLGNPFLYIEAKAPDKFEDGQKDIKGQLFELSDLEEKQNKTKVKYLVYYSFDTSEELADRMYLIEKDEYKEYDDWLEGKDKTFGLEIPYNYGKPKLKERVKDEDDSDLLSISEFKMSEIRRNIHNTLWSSGVEDNEAYIFLVKFLLTKIYDEDETAEDEKYQCQIYDKDYDDETKFFDRINKCYKDALQNKLNYTEEDLKNVGNILTTEKISIQSLYFLVKELQNYSFSKSIRTQKKDILGHFFEETNREKFKQSKGQFFTTTNVVDFLVYAMKVDELAIKCFEKDYSLPYIIDPSAGSGTFLIEAMKIITKEFSKHDFKLTNTKKSKLKKLFPEEKPNDWAEQYIYGIDNSYSLTVSTKVNMILHGDGSSNTFKDDGLKSLQTFSKYTNTKLATYETGHKVYNKTKGNIGVNEQFDVIISNPPFSVNINDSKEEVDKYYLFGKKKNSENLFLERYYQLLKEGGRLGVVLPESVFDTTENKYIRLFLFKYFKIKAVVSLPQITFEPFTSTKTSILFAQKKKVAEIEKWNIKWDKFGKEWSLLKTRMSSYVQFFTEDKKLNKKWAKDVVSDIEKNNTKNILKNIHRFLKDYLTKEDKVLKIKELLTKYSSEITDLSKYEKETEVFGFYNAWWVFGEVAKEMDIDYDIFMAEAENVGYKRTKRGENPRPNDLFDIEYAPKKLECSAIIDNYDNKIKTYEDDQLEAKTKKTAIEAKKKTAKTKKSIKKFETEIEELKTKIEELKAEKETVIEILAIYYENDILKAEYDERTDIDLINHFDKGLLEKHRCNDVLLRKKETHKILDSIRKEVIWE